MMNTLHFYKFSTTFCVRIMERGSGVTETDWRTESHPPLTARNSTPTWKVVIGRRFRMRRVGSKDGLRVSVECLRLRNMPSLIFMRMRFKLFVTTFRCWSVWRQYHDL